MPRLLALVLLLVAGCSDSGALDASSSSVDAAALTADAAVLTADAAAAATGDAAVQNADSWANFGQGFFAGYCTRCHTAGSPTRDYTRFDHVQRDALEIACGVNPGPNPLPGCASFPPPRQFPIGSGPFPSDADRARLVSWIQAGLAM